MKVLVVVPAYNVEFKIAPVLEFLNDYHLDAVIINDGSTDNTESVIQRYNIPFIDIPVNTGLSNAIIKGIDYALSNEFTHIITIDSDGQHSPNKLFEFIEKLNEYDFVFGNRFHSVESIPSCKLSANSLISAFYKELFEIWIPDISCGYKGFRVSEQLRESLKSNDQYAIVFSIVNQAIHRKLTMLPVESIYFQNEFLSTRRIEIISFWKALSKLSDRRIKSYDYIIDAVNNKRDFDTVLCGIHYYAFYLERNDSYILQADIEKMQKLYLNN